MCACVGMKLYKREPNRVQLVICKESSLLDFRIAASLYFLMKWNEMKLCISATKTKLSFHGHMTVWGRRHRTHLTPVTGFFLPPHSDAPQNKMKKLGEDVRALARLLGELESCVGRQKEQLKQLKVRMEACRWGWCCQFVEAAVVKTQHLCVFLYVLPGVC